MNGLKPLLFLDVDGPLNVNAPPDRVMKWGYSRHFFKVTGAERSFHSWVSLEEYKLYKRGRRRSSTFPVDHEIMEFDLSPYVAKNLASLADSFELTWATTWEDEANAALLNLLNLPAPLPVVHFPSKNSRALDPLGLHWKARALLEYAGDRPFLWVDDEPSGTTRKWVRDVSPGSDVLRVTNSRGLLPEDFDHIRRFFHGV